MTDIATTLLAGGGVVTPLGLGIAFIWNKLDKKALETAAEFDKRLVKIETELDLCRRENLLSQERRTILLRINDIFWQELRRVAPDSWALTKAKELMEEAKALDTLGPNHV